MLINSQLTKLLKMYLLPNLCNERCLTYLVVQLVLLFWDHIVEV
jgi:hypothetical protein